MADPVYYASDDDLGVMVPIDGATSAEEAALEFVGLYAVEAGSTIYVTLGTTTDEEVADGVHLIDSRREWVFLVGGEEDVHVQV